MNLTLPGTFLDCPDVARQQLTQAFKSLSRGLPVRPLTTAPRIPIPMMDFCYVREDAVKPPLTPLYQGPFRVLRQLRNTVLIQRGEREEVVSLNRIKPYLGSETPEVAQPPTRGRLIVQYR